MGGLKLIGKRLDNFPVGSIFVRRAQSERK